MTTPAKPEDAAERRRLAEAKVAELETQVGALLEARAKLEAEAHRYADLYDSAPVGYFTLGSDGAIRELNFAGAQLLGAERARLVGRRFEVFVAEASRSSFSSFLEGVLATKAKRTCVVDLASERGAPVAVTIEGTVSSDGRECRAVVMELTEGKRVADRLARLQSITAALGAALAPAEAAQVILSTGLAATGAQAGIVTRAIDQGRYLEVLGEVGDANTSAYAMSHLPTDVVDSRTRFSIGGRNPLSDVVRSRSAVWLQNKGEIQAQYPEHASFFEKAGSRAVIALPLISRGQLIGALRLSFSQERTLDGEERAFLAAFAQQCALALDRAQLYEDAILARHLAERATRMRDELLSIVAHDLGNPMNTIGIWAAVVLGAPVAGAEGETIVADVVEAYAPLCVEKGLSITGLAPALRIACDRNRIGQVLGNLVANAIKFTPNGGTIAIEALPLERDVRFSVADSGAGIAEEAREHVFERYWRGEDSDHAKGVGLGLFISKGIIASHGGKIWVESAVGRGTTFYFTLPVAPAD